MLKILLQAFFCYLKKNVNRNKRGFSMPSKQLRLFLQEEVCKNYRYSAYVTNMIFAPAEIWRLYRGRANAENRPEQ